MRTERPVKMLRRAPVVGDNAPDRVRTAGASGSPRSARKRPGRAASLQSISANTRSQKWRAPNAGAPNMRRGNLAKGSRTGRNRAKPAR